MSTLVKHHNTNKNQQKQSHCRSYYIIEQKTGRKLFAHDKIFNRLFLETPLDIHKEQNKKTSGQITYLPKARALLIKTIFVRFFP